MTASSAPADKRAERRLKVFHLAEVGPAPQRDRCHVLNLSAQGALLDCRAMLTVRSDVSLSFPGFQRDAVVRWREGSRMGVAFRAPLTTTELAEAL